MTFSYNLVLALFLLAPGFAVFAGLYLGSQLGRIKSPPPLPGSILTLAIVTVGALAAHLAGSAVFLAQAGICATAFPCGTVAFDPNPYTSLLAAGRPGPAITDGQVTAMLLTLVLLTALAFWVSRATVARLASRTALSGVLYGWLAEVAVATSADEAILAYVLSDVEESGTIVGYEGALANMTANADKEITSVLLRSCETFYLRVTAEGVVREKVAKATPIPQLYLDHEHIKNIAFERVRFD